MLTQRMTNSITIEWNVLLVCVGGILLDWSVLRCSASFPRKLSNDLHQPGEPFWLPHKICLPLHNEAPQARRAGLWGEVDEEGQRRVGGGGDVRPRQDDQERRERGGGKWRLWDPNNEEKDSSRGERPEKFEDHPLERGAILN